MKVVLIGFAASYKTTVGKIVASRLNCVFYDVDSIVEKAADSTVSEIFAQQGEQTFRKLEDCALKSLTASVGVISCGGGSVLSKSFEEVASNAKIVWLKTSAESVKSRLTVGTRPLFDNLTVEQLSEKIAEREKLYAAFADVCITTDNKTSAQVAQEVLCYLHAQNCI